MRKWVLSAAAFAAIALALPLLAYAGGWAGSIYDKSECTYTKESDTLYCETTQTTETVMTAVLSFPDASCPNGTTGVSRTGTLVEVWRVFGQFAGHVPHSKRERFGDEELLSDEWRNFTDTPLGCN